MCWAGGAGDDELLLLDVSGGGGPGFADLNCDVEASRSANSLSSAFQNPYRGVKNQAVTESHSYDPLQTHLSPVYNKTPLHYMHSHRCVRTHAPLKFHERGMTEEKKTLLKFQTQLRVTSVTGVGFTLDTLP